MARSDLLLSLVKAGTTGNRPAFARAVEALIADERAKRHVVLAERLDTELRRTPDADARNGVPALFNRGQVEHVAATTLVHEATAARGLDQLLLPEAAAAALRELVEEQQRADVLRSHNLEPRHRVLLSGPPGNGKTSIAEGLAYELMVPLLTVRYDALIGSYLGETATRLRKLFERASTRACVLFFDEFDTLGKERGDAQDSGEIKRIVSSLLLQMDDLPSYVVVVTATNHAELLDRAVWRRFQLRLQIPPPGRGQLTQFVEAWQDRLGRPFGYAARTLADKLGPTSFAEAEEFLLDLARRQVLAGGGAPARSIADARLRQWKSRVTQANAGDAR
ncbi:AAA family ATPase [Phycisphaera mikurensis]|uniref:Putative ATPase n=1 Tax=Phycisphaera mikurensis (strain NBRC 102666 / KCTC 22515 / FYK2301M01) TaxID=1142394 RepID=I0IF58_PHYMF|nr:ATP-binding protein [Phycisphaera mikurensis]MBB6440708.1 AAA+ superfamily predicted ATPase [Phycisphaera mikurensis]BAM03896.1 putative ATPase [Phycisphaera mikurensis NBRC 102666]